MYSIPIEERRIQSSPKRLFERRLQGGDDTRLIGYFEQMGARRVKAFVENSVLGPRTIAANRWLKSQKQPGAQRFLLMGSGLAAVLTLVVAVRIF